MNKRSNIQKGFKYMTENWWRCSLLPILEQGDIYLQITPHVTNMRSIYEFFNEHIARILPKLPVYTDWITVNKLIF